jgi:hypothetical protein
MATLNEKQAALFTDRKASEPSPVSRKRLG